LAVAVFIIIAILDVIVAWGLYIVLLSVNPPTVTIMGETVEEKVIYSKLGGRKTEKWR
jgi:hypothetical protein